MNKIQKQNKNSNKIKRKKNVYVINRNNNNKMIPFRRVRTGFPVGYLHHNYVKHFIDPFNSDGVRIPDENNARTVALKLVNEYMMTTSDGYCLKTEYPGLYQSHGYITISSSGELGTSETKSDHPDYDEVYAAFSYLRLVSISAEGTCQLSEDDASGTVFVSTGADILDVSGITLSDLTSKSEYSGRVKDGFRVVHTPNQTFRFGKIKDEEFGQTEFESLSFIIGGGPDSKDTILVKVTRHYEGIPFRNSLLYGTAKRENCSYLATQVAANMNSREARVAPNHAGGAKMLRDSALRSANTAAQNALTEVSQKALSSLEGAVGNLASRGISQLAEGLVGSVTI
jgi:ribosomal protein L36